MTAQQVTPNASDNDYAIRKVTHLRAECQAMFDLPATQETLRDALRNHLAEAQRINQAPVLEAEAQKERQASKL